MAVSHVLLYPEKTLTKSFDLTPQGPLSHGRGGGGHTLLPPTAGIIVMAVSRLLLHLK